MFVKVMTKVSEDKHFDMSVILLTKLLPVWGDCEVHSSCLVLSELWLPLEKRFTWTIGCLVLAQVE